MGSVIHIYIYFQLSYYIAISRVIWLGYFLDDGMYTLFRLNFSFVPPDDHSFDIFQKIPLDSTIEHYRHDLYKYLINLHILFPISSFMESFWNNKWTCEMLHWTQSVRWSKWPHLSEGQVINYSCDEVVYIWSLSEISTEGFLMKAHRYSWLHLKTGFWVFTGTTATTPGLI